MRIGFDARWYNDSGVGNYVAGLLNALTACPDLQIVAYADALNPIPHLQSSRVCVIPLPSSRYSVGGQVELAWRCRKDKLDLFHSPFYVVPFAASCPVVVTVHDLIPFLFPLYTRLKQATVKMGYRAAALRAAHIIADSQVTSIDLQRLLRVPEEQISVVHLAVSAKDFQPRASDEELVQIEQNYGITPPYVVVASPRNWRTKNLEGAIQAISLAKQIIEQPFQTVVYGTGGSEALKGNERPELNMIQTGFLPSYDLGAIFRGAAAFVLPSLYEGFGLPLLEAMSCGCPVVTSNGGSLGEVAGNGAQVFDPTDISGMAEAMAGLLSSADERARWRERALARASEFSWHKAAAQTSAVYRQVCNRRLAQTVPTPGRSHEAQRTRS